MSYIPTQVSALLEALKGNVPRILGSNLVGIYVYGSLTQNAFEPKHSDIDCIVVTRRDLSDAQFTRLDEWFQRSAGSNPWTTRLQITFLLRDEVLIMNSKACLYQFGQLKRCGSDGNPIIWLNVLQSGIVLYGPPASTFVPTITREVLFQALEREVGYLREEIVEKADSEWRDVPSYRVYAVLTLCRILYSFNKGTIVSKPNAAKWAIKQMGDHSSGIIRQALTSGISLQSPAIDLSQIQLFIRFVDHQLRSLSIETNTT